MSNEELDINTPSNDDLHLGDLDDLPMGVRVLPDGFFAGDLDGETGLQTELQTAAGVEEEEEDEVR
jgi:hypothetical protein